jgi:hypothetical protein
MSPEAVTRAMAKAKVYIDFGSHPGRDRMPREAALERCIVITGKFGSARGRDVPIPEEFKLSTDPQSICDSIKAAMDNYPGKSAAFDLYREWIRQQRATFQREVAQLESFFSSPPPPIVFDHPALDHEWVSLQKELHAFRGALSRTAIVEAICVQMLRFKKSAFAYLFLKILTRLKLAR